MGFVCLLSYLLTPDWSETKTADFPRENGKHCLQWWGKGNPRQGKQGGDHPGHVGHHWDHPQLGSHHLCLYLHHLVGLKTLIVHHQQADQSLSVLLQPEYVNWYGDKDGRRKDEALLPKWWTGSKTVWLPYGVHPASLQTTETMGHWLVPLPFTGRIIQNFWTLLTLRYSKCMKLMREALKMQILPSWRDMKDCKESMDTYEKYFSDVLINWMMEMICWLGWKMKMYRESKHRYLNWCFFSKILSVEHNIYISYTVT